MTWICPTVTATTKEDYRRQLKQALKLSKRVHLDVSDGSLAPRELIEFARMTWPEKAIVDIHVMSLHPQAEVIIATEKKPHAVIIHAESKIDFLSVAKRLSPKGIKAGIALLPETPVSEVKDIVHAFDYALIFSGNLGYQGGSIADLSLLSKVLELKTLNPRLEIAWDGGINDGNIFELASRGVNVLNVGGFVQHSKYPKKAYAKLEVAIKNPKNDVA